MPQQFPFTKNVLARVMVIAAAVLLFGSDTVSADKGEAAFKARCGDCHSQREFPRWARARPDAEKRAVWLDEFLQRHYPPPKDERALIVDYIERAIAAAR